MFMLINRRARAIYSRKYLHSLIDHDASWYTKVISYPNLIDLEMLFLRRIPQEFLSVMVPDWMATLKFISDFDTYVRIIRFLWSEGDQILMVSMVSNENAEYSILMSQELKELMIRKICSQKAKPLIQVVFAID